MHKIIVSLLLLSGSMVLGQQTGIYWENDGTFAKPNGDTDRHYTNGARLECLWDASENENVRDLAGKLLFLGPDKDNSNLNTGFFIGQHMQTPDFISRPELRSKPEMRYAGWLYGGLIMQSGDTMAMSHLELSLGVIGPSARGHEAQDWIHFNRGLETAADWDTQLSDRFAGNLNWLYKFRIGSREYYEQKPVRLELIGETALAAGTVHRNVGTGITVRLGTNLPGDFGPATITRPKYYRFDENVSNIMLFARVAGSAVEHNELLTDLEKETFTGEFQMGVTVSIAKFEIGYSQVYMTKQYKYQPESDSYGAFFVRMHF